MADGVRAGSSSGAACAFFVGRHPTPVRQPSYPLNYGQPGWQTVAWRRSTDDAVLRS